jgi:class 3 adenylate cyclase
MQSLKFVKQLFFLFVFLLPEIILAQNQPMDSLVAELKHAKNDTNTLAILADLSNIAPDGRWQAYNDRMGSLARQLMQSKNLSIRNSSKHYYSIFITNRAVIAAEKADFTHAISLLEQSLKIDRELGDPKSMALTMNNIGAIYDRMGEIDQAMIYYKRSLALQTGSIKNEFVSKQYNEIIATYNNLGVIYNKKKQLDSAMYFYQQALALAKKFNNKDNIVCGLFVSVGSFYELKNEFAKANEYYQAGLKMSEEIGDKVGISRNLYGIACLKLKQSHLNEALSFGLRALKASEERENTQDFALAADLLKKVYEKKGDYKKAYSMYRLEMKSRDSLQRIDNQRALIKHQYKYEFDLKSTVLKAAQDKKDAIALEEMQKQKIVRNVFIAGFSIMLFFALIFFIQSNKIKKGKKLSDELLLNILPHEVAEELKQNGSALPKHFDEVTVLFTDFVQFTQHAEQMTAGDLVASLNDCFTAFDAIIERNGLEKIKTIGDAYMAVCGLPCSDKEHAIKSVRAALEIRDYMHQRHQTKGGFEIRIGLNSGTAVAGIVGVKKFAYDIWGDTVNFAARMESSGEVGKVNISQSTYELVKDHFNCEFRGRISAKNKGHVDMYFVET